MKIKLAYEDSYFDEKSRILGHCFTITENNRTFHYEFIPLKQVAKIQSDTTAYLEEVVQFFYKTHPTITTYYGNDFYMEMEKSFSFKLPISILQVSKFFLDEAYLSNLRKYATVENILIPVQIIEDEYVVLDNHHLLCIAKELGIKLVDVYLDKLNPYTLDFLYLAKEQNIKTVSDMKCLKHEEYTKITTDLMTLFNNI